jgi:hypothetical protein
MPCCVGQLGLPVETIAIIERAMLALSNRSHIGVFEDGEARIVPVAMLRERYRVDALIRLAAADYALFEPMRGRFVHFNLEVTLNEAGKRYAVLPILKPGRRDKSGVEILPVIDPQRYRIGICEEVLQRVPVGEVTPAHFAHSLPNIRTRDELETALLGRYAPMFPRLSAAEILARGCAVTTLALP